MSAPKNNIVVLHTHATRTNAAATLVDRVDNINSLLTVHKDKIVKPVVNKQLQINRTINSSLSLNLPDSTAHNTPDTSATDDLLLLHSPSNKGFNSSTPHATKSISLSNLVSQATHNISSAFSSLFIDTGGWGDERKRTG